MTQKQKKTPRQLAESQIRSELTKQGKIFLAYGTFVNNRDMARIVKAALIEQKKANNPTFAISSFARAIRFPYEENYYLVEMLDGVSKVHLFNDGIVSPEILYEEEATPEVCKKHFIKYMENAYIAFEEQGGDWEG